MTSMPDLPVDQYNFTTCVHLPVGSNIRLINRYQLGFPSKFLITRWWGELHLETPLYVLGSLQVVVSLLLIIYSFGKHVDRRDLLRFANHKLLPIYTGVWSLSYTLMVLCLPRFWMSNVVMGFILYHAFAEFWGLVLRFVIIMHHHKSNPVTTLHMRTYWRWMVFVMVALTIPFSLISDPVTQGRITAIAVLPADFMNLFVAPYLARLWIRKNPNSRRSEKMNEILSAALYVNHVVWFYIQGIFACKVSVLSGAIYFLVFMTLGLLISIGLLITNIKIKRDYKEMIKFPQHIKLLLLCIWPSDDTIKQEHMLSPSSVPLRKGDEDNVEDEELDV